MAGLIPLWQERARHWNSGVSLRRFKFLGEIVDSTIRERSLAGQLAGGSRWGATARRVVVEIVGGGFRIVALGAAGGIAGSVLTGQLLQPLLYAVSPLDGVSFAIALAVLCGAALIACSVPAYQAIRRDPIQALNLQ